MTAPAEEVSRFEETVGAVAPDVAGLLSRLEEAVSGADIRTSAHSIYGEGVRTFVHLTIGGTEQIAVFLGILRRGLPEKEKI